jgi:hypothetical protein
MNQKNKPVVYQSHPFDSEFDGLSKLFYIYLEREFHDWTWVNPFDHELTVELLQKPEDVDVCQKVVVKDLQEIIDCDFMVAFLPAYVGDKPCWGIGTSQEIFFARYCLGIPVYIVSPFKHAWFKGLGVIHEHDVFSLINRLKRDYPKQ